jgi:hypothetical protein
MPRLRKSKDKDEVSELLSELQMLDRALNDDWQSAPFGLPPSFKRFIQTQGLKPRLVEPRWPEATH